MKKEEKPTHVRFDWAIKRLLRNKANFVVLEGFLSELLGEDITITDCLESEGNQKSKKDKYNRVDILVQNAKKEIIWIEVQNDSEYDYFHKMLYGSSKLVTEYIKLKEKYRQIRKIYSINIVYFDLGQGQDYIYKAETEFIGYHKNDKLALSDGQKELFRLEQIAGIFPTYYLLKINNFNDKAKDRLDEWIYFLKHSTIKKSFTAKGLKEADEIMSLDRMTEKERRAYIKYLEDLSYEDSIAETKKFDQDKREEKIRKEGVEEGIELGIEKGIELGIEKEREKQRLEKNEIIIEMIKDGLSDNQISKIIKSDVSDIILIRKKLKIKE